MYDEDPDVEKEMIKENVRAAPPGTLRRDCVNHRTWYVSTYRVIDIREIRSDI
jgi:hypothetical protein